MIKLLLSLLLSGPVPVDLATVDLAPSDVLAIEMEGQTMPLDASDTCTGGWYYQLVGSTQCTHAFFVSIDYGLSLYDCGGCMLVLGVDTAAISDPETILSSDTVTGPLLDCGSSGANPVPFYCPIDGAHRINFRFDCSACN